MSGGTRFLLFVWCVHVPESPQKRMNVLPSYQYKIVGYCMYSPLPLSICSSPPPFSLVWCDPFVCTMSCLGLVSEDLFFPGLVSVSVRIRFSSGFGFGFVQSGPVRFGSVSLSRLMVGLVHPMKRAGLM